MTVVDRAVVKLVDGGVVRAVEPHGSHLECFPVVVGEVGNARRLRRHARFKVTCQRHDDVRVGARPVDDHLVVPVVQVHLKNKRQSMSYGKDTMFTGPRWRPGLSGREPFVGGES